ncbi:MAG TPA: excinuclease ABC subunit UvrC [Cyclobacteriaceae bacterium]|nr:excinuclease ABC subunit UvrC [Cyclobacteriaceae bacterium]
MSGSKSIPAYNHLPELSGIYRFYNKEEILIYVGKAKNLKKRVASYFSNSSGLSRKTLRLAHETAKIEYTLAENETDALLLENNFIKQYQPKYNILLKDDKTFPYLCILKEPFPRIISTRTFDEKKGEYFGPFSSVLAMKTVLELIRKLYKIRTCNLNLTDENINTSKFKVCLEYHIGNCLGPCEGLQHQKEYLEEIDQARNIIKGKLSLVSSYFQNKMKLHAEKLEFEKANDYKFKLDIIEKFQSKSVIVNRQLSDIDIITIVSNAQYAFINYMQIEEGAIILSKTFEAAKRFDETDEEVFENTVNQIRSKYNSNNKLLLTNVEVALDIEGFEIQTPIKGDKKKLILLSIKNALQLKQENELRNSDITKKVHESVLHLQRDLKLKNAPMVIECFDNSNLMGSSAVASMVQFVNGKPLKKEYRHFNIKTVEGPNDFASMHEIITRRYKRLITEDKTLPDLIVVDGGKGQLSAAVSALKELKIYTQVPIIGIAKRLEEIYFPEDSIPLHINKKSLSLQLIQKLRDEAHRFAINFHRQKRSKKSISNSLESIKGIGKSSQNLLLQKFKSWNRIKSKTFDELAEVVGPSKAQIIIDSKKKEA